jgi:hypothetical protein
VYLSWNGKHETETRTYFLDFGTLDSIIFKVWKYCSILYIVWERRNGRLISFNKDLYRKGKTVGEEE